jgi:hypothetical protein
VLVPGPLAPVAYVTRPGGRRIMLVRPGPSIEPNLLDFAQVLPVQLPHRHGPAATGFTASIPSQRIIISLGSSLFNPCFIANLNSARL